MEALFKEKSLEICFKILELAGLCPIESKEAKKKIIIGRIALVSTVILGFLGEVQACFVASNFQEWADHFSASVAVFLVILRLIHYKINYNDFKVMNEMLTELINVCYDERFETRHHITHRINYCQRSSKHSSQLRVLQYWWSLVSWSLWTNCHTFGRIRALKTRLHCMSLRQFTWLWHAAR